jgi:hypothetical protein
MGNSSSSSLKSSSKNTSIFEKQNFTNFIIAFLYVLIELIIYIIAAGVNLWIAKVVYFFPNSTQNFNAFIRKWDTESKSNNKFVPYTFDEYFSFNQNGNETYGIFNSKRDYYITNRIKAKKIFNIISFDLAEVYSIVERTFKGLNDFYNTLNSTWSFYYGSVLIGCITWAGWWYRFVYSLFSRSNETVSIIALNILMYPFLIILYLIVHVMYILNLLYYFKRFFYTRLESYNGEAKSILRINQGESTIGWCWSLAWRMMFLFGLISSVFNLQIIFGIIIFIYVLWKISRLWFGFKSNYCKPPPTNNSISVNSVNVNENIFSNILKNEVDLTKDYTYYESILSVLKYKQSLLLWIYAYYIIKMSRTNSKIQVFYSPIYSIVCVIVFIFMISFLHITGEGDWKTEKEYFFSETMSNFNMKEFTNFTKTKLKDRTMKLSENVGLNINNSKKLFGTDKKLFGPNIPLQTSENNNVILPTIVPSENK